MLASKDQLREMARNMIPRIRKNEPVTSEQKMMADRRMHQMAKDAMKKVM